MVGAVEISATRVQLGSDRGVDLVRGLARREFGLTPALVRLAAGRFKKPQPVGVKLSSSVMKRVLRPIRDPF